MRIIVRLSKGDAVRYTSHLDLQRLMQRAFRRAQLPLAYSAGFNPHPLMSFATALSVGQTSEAEWFDVKLATQMDTAEFISRVNAVLPTGFAILEAIDAGEFSKSLSSLMCLVDYEITLIGDTKNLIEHIESLLLGEIIVNKKTKSGMKDVNIRPDIIACYMTQRENGEVYMKVRGRLDVNGGLNIELFISAIKAMHHGTISAAIHRKAIYGNGLFLPTATDEA